ncbi:hypothetical protein [Variovorax sp. JS1663]|uniref:hypothetical protein n=1 Tax=Variovorax sp. JS1663 TaxID=1851577 RepID=UPI000B348285|nr:hypothetical protein [Variovorax sp. JS1663]OUM00776.1 hypothetical protein A8M77_18965 [Variovorax sp. JS1663]
MIREAQGPVAHAVGSSPDNKLREALLKEYGDVANNFRGLADVRFKLLNLLPIAAAATAAFKGDKPDGLTFFISLFGLAVTIGLLVYNARNDQLYDELVGRAAAIERAVSLPDGAYANRPRPWLDIHALGHTWNVDHRSAVALIYSATICLWLTLGLASILETLRQYFVGIGWDRLKGSHALFVVQLCSFAAAALATFAWGQRIVGEQVSARRKLLIRLAKEAVASMLATTWDFPMRAPGERAIRLCACLARSRDFLAELHDLPLCKELTGVSKARLYRKEKHERRRLLAEFRQARKAVRARSRFFGQLTGEELQVYIPVSSPAMRSAYLVALLTDLPARWIFDCWAGRRISISGQAGAVTKKTWEDDGRIGLRKPPPPSRPARRGS